MLKKRPVVMLPTEKADRELKHIYLRPDGYILSCFTTNQEYKPRHLYILSDDKIEEGDYYYDMSGGGKMGIFQCTNEAVQANEDKIPKVIASTDESLGLPKVSEGFIKKYVEKYNAGTPITHVMVEYEEEVPGDGAIKPKVDSHNTITIKPVKDSYTLEEVKHALFQLWQYNPKDTETFDEWFEQNF